MNEPVVVASDQSGVYVRVAKGKVIYFNDGGNDTRLRPPMGWCSARAVCDVIERMRKSSMKEPRVSKRYIGG